MCVAARIKLLLAEVAIATRDSKRYYNPITIFQVLYSRADLHYFAHGLVAQYVATLHRRHKAVEEMEIRTADPARRDLNDRISGLFNLWIWDIIHSYVTFSVPTKSFHLKSLESIDL
jgi:hypothetical protein